jgi:hypothetical protein
MGWSPLWFGIQPLNPSPVVLKIGYTLFVPDTIDNGKKMKF